MLPAPRGEDVSVMIGRRGQRDTSVWLRVTIILRKSGRYFDPTSEGNARDGDLQKTAFCEQHVLLRA